MKKPTSTPPLNQVACPGCGKAVHDQAVGCPSCGTAVYVEHPADITPTKHPSLDFPGKPNVPSPSPRSTADRPTPDQCVVAQYGKQPHVDLAIEVLEKSGFSSDEISVIQHESAIAGSGLENTVGNDASDAADSDTPTTKGTFTAASTVGGVLGGAAGAATAFGPLLILGPLAGLLAGAVGGGAFAAVDGWGVDRANASQYESEVRNGKQLIIVSSHDPIRLDNAMKALKTANHESIRRFTFRSAR